MNAETAQNEKKVEDSKTNPEEAAIKTEDQKAEVNQDKSPKKIKKLKILILTISSILTS